MDQIQQIFNKFPTVKICDFDQAIFIGNSDLLNYSTDVVMVAIKS